MSAAARFLTVVRLSAARDASTSPERQREHCMNAITVRGGTEVGVAEDLAVSATKYSPFQRPGLGPWLTDPEKLAQWDTLVVWRLDRLVRSTKDLAELLAWCQENSKGVISATEGFDLGSPIGRAMVSIIAALGQLEAETTKLRVDDAHAKLRTMDRWASGVPPLGFKTVDHPSGRGKGLATDTEGRELVREMADELLSGWSFTKIAQWCNETGQHSAMDRARIAKGEKPHGKPWTIGNVRRILTSPATQGWKMSKLGGNSYDGGKPVLDESGQPIRMAPPTFNTAEWERIQLAVAQRTANGKRRTHTPNPMFGVGRCGAKLHTKDCEYRTWPQNNPTPCECPECGSTLAQQFTRESVKQFEARKAKDPTAERREYRSYRCGRTPVNCKGVSIHADGADEMMEDGFLSEYGHLKVKERVFVPGTDNRAEIEQTKASLARLRAESDAGLITDDDGWLERMKSLTARLHELEKSPYRPSRWDEIETDQTYRDAWNSADWEQRRELLQNARFTFTLVCREPLTIRTYIEAGMTEAERRERVNAWRGEVGMESMEEEEARYAAMQERD